MLTAWKKMKDVEAIIKEELRLFGSSETLEMIANGYNSSIAYDANAGLVIYGFEAYSPTRKEVARFSLEAKQMGCQTTANASGPATLELIISSPEEPRIRIFSTRRPGKESLAKTSIEFPFTLKLRTAYLLYRLADLFEIAELEEFPFCIKGMEPEELKNYLQGYLSEGASGDSNSSYKQQDNSVPKPFRQLLDELGFSPGS